MAIGPTTSSLTASRYALAGQYSPTPDSITAATFQQWPTSVQADFVASFAAGGKPAAILVGAPGSQIIAVLSPGGGDVDVTVAPAGINDAPSQLGLSAFQSWPSEAQIFYAQVNGSGVPPAVEIGTAGATLTATLVVGADGIATGVALGSSAGLTSRYDATSSKAPANLDPAEFFLLPPDEQYAYVLKNGSGLPPAVAIGPSGGQAATSLALSSNGRPFTVAVAPNTYPGFSDALTGQGSAVRTFADWPREVQRAYVDSQASGPAGTYPKTVVLSGSIASIAAQGADVDVTPLPAGFAAPGLPGAGTFLSWPEAAQIAFARTRLQDQNAASPLALGGRGAQMLEVRLKGDGSGISLGSPVAQNVSPANLDLDLFQLWPVADRTLYLQANGTGTPKSLVVGNDVALLSAAAGGGVAVDAFPAAFRSAPGLLTPTTYLSWSPAFRALYTVRNGALNAGVRTLAIGPTGQQINTQVAGGALSVSNDILRIDPAKSLTLGLAIPTENIFGGDGGLNADPNASNAETLFPTLSGQSGTTGAGAAYTIVDKPPAIAAQFALGPTALSRDDFGKWNTAIQLEYLRLHGDAAHGYATTIGSAGNTVTAFIGTGGASPFTFSKVYTVETLQKTDIGKMSAADQAVLAGLPAFYKVDPLGVTAPTGAGVALGLIPGRASAAAIVDSFVNAIRTPSDDPSSPNYVKGGDSHMPAADKKIFLDELAILSAKIQAGSIFSAKDINDQVADIKTRFERMNCFAVNLYKPGSRDPESQISNYSNAKITTTLNIQPVSIDVIQFMAIAGQIKLPDQPYKGEFTYQFPQPLPVINGQPVSAITISVGPMSNPVGIDQNAGIKAAYDTFKAQEAQLLNLATNRQNLASGTGPANTQNLDVPNLVYLFQLYSNLAGEAKIRADTEEINQTNAFLKVYAVMQNLINSTVKSFDPKDTNDSHGLRGSNADGSLTAEEQAVVEMFKSSKLLSPIEAFKNISRPTDNFNDRKMTQWQTYGQQLSDRVTLINQESQIRMNDINSQTKAKDRNFDLANNALSKMNEIVQKIGNAA